MSDQENTPAAVLAHQHDPDGALARENVSLRQQLAALQSNVVHGGFRGEAPRYHLNSAGYYDDTWFPEGSHIDYLDTPNDTMVPLNEPGKRAYREFMEHIEYGARAKAALAGRTYFGQVNDRNVLIDQAREDAQRAAAAPVAVVQMPVIHGQVPAMPHTDAARAQERRGPGRPRKVLDSAPPAPQGQAKDLGAPTLAPAPREAAILGRQVG